ncbi:AT-rich interactive domain-containing protein 2-like [Silene latifolia]|uniref:AT-rich interactive domain-containing protein 2-like n=1 Tax=Silene latifolia TaxID=37657 RepID=UPI003D76B99F
MAGLSIFEDGSEEKCSGNSSELMDVCVVNSDDDINWGDCDDKLRCLFDQILMVLMRGVYAKNGIRQIPALLGDGRPVDLFKLFCLVRDRGGFRSVSEDNLWGLIAEKFGFGYELCSSLKLIYFKYLDELDQWLNRITRDRISENGSWECGGNLGMLSLELEKRFRDYSTDGKELGGKEDVRGFYDFCNHMNAGTSNEWQNGLIECKVNYDENLCNRNDFAGKANLCAFDSSRKRKRDVFVEMLSWMMNVSRNPDHFFNGESGECSKGKGNQDHDLRSVALSVREARLHRKFSYSNDEQSSLNQKKHKMHPSMFEVSDEGLRCSKRLLTVVKAPACHCCKSGPDNPCKLESDSRLPSENGSHIEEHVSTDLPTSKKIVVPVPVDDDVPPIENHVLVGPRFQVDVPVWTGIALESDSKWVGTQIWVPDYQDELSGKGRPEFCKCRFPSSVECHRFHIAESRFNLRKKLGVAFYHWKFDRMGEEVSLSWTIEDEMKFKHIMRLNIPHLGKSHFRKKRRTDLVSYYFNVYLINRRSYQNRVIPKEINSDDDETEFGSVGEAFGCNAVKGLRSEPLVCYQNEQVFDFD